ncbi:hypothetical protein [Candidimonas nitroreducens]|nr:hypothetical protein [Candidimonas nitroreducens]
MRSRSALVYGALLCCLPLTACQHLAPKPDAAQAPPAAPTMAAPPAFVAPRPPPQQAQKAAVGFMLAQGQQAQGLSPLKTAKGMIWVLPRPAMTQADLGRVEARRWDKGQPFVRFGFSPEGAKKLANISSRYKGKILVVAVGSSIIGLMRLDGPVGNGTLDLPVASERAAIDIANAVGLAPRR